MYRIRIFIALAGLLFCSSTLFSQGLKRKMADQYFDIMEYYKAAPIYNELAIAAVKKNQPDDQLFRRAAISNQSTYNYQKSVDWYGKLVEMNQASDEDWLNYIRVLHYTKNYDKVKEIVASTGNKFDAIPMIKEIKNNPDYIQSLYQDSADIKISEVGINSGFGEFSPAFYKEGIVFVSKKWSAGLVNRKFGMDGGNFVNLYFAKYDKNSKVGKSRKSFQNIFSSKFHNGPICFNATYDMAVVTRDDLSKTSSGELVRLMLFTSQKDSKGKWTSPAPLPFNSKSYSVAHPSLSADGKTLYFASDMPGGMGKTDIWKSTWDGNTWSNPVNLGDKVNTPGNEMFPFIHSHGNLYFASDGHAGLGGLDIFVAYDIEKSPSVENLGYPANTNMDDFGIILDENGENGYLSSNRIRSNKKKDQIPTDYIYGVKLSIPEFNLNGVVVNNDTKEKLANAEVKITNSKTGEIITVNTDDNGYFSQKLKTHSSYTISAGKEKFELMNTESVSTEGIRTSKNFDVELKLSSLYLTFTGTVVDSKTKLPIANATFKLKESNSADELSFTTDNKGQITTELKKNQEFNIHASAHDYLATNESFNTINTSGVKFEKTFELTLFAKKGDVVKLDHIYYDLGKWDLRDEGKAELDKLVEYLAENPTVKIELSSHTDSRNSSTSNQKLSQKRAESCVNYLISKGIAKDRMIAKGYGETKLVNGCKDGVTCTEEEHQQNRRTEVKILSN